MTNNPTSITPAEYFNSLIDLEGRDIGRPVEQTTKTQKFKANLSLCENYPLSLPEQVTLQTAWLTSHCLNRCFYHQFNYRLCSPTDSMANFSQPKPVHIPSV